MLSPYRRHSADCKHLDKGIGYTNCKCPIWVYGQTDDGRTIRQSLKTRDWSRANRRIEQLARTPSAAAAVITSTPALPGDAIAVPKGIAVYLADCERRRLAESTLKSYRKTFSAFAKHCDGEGIDYMRDLSLAVFGSFHAGRKRTTAKSQRTEIEHLRAFCSFAVMQDWMKKNFAKAIKPPKDEDPETLPFDRNEVARLIAASDQLFTERPRGFGGDWRSEEELGLERRHARALILLLLYSGLRISDALTLRRERLNMQTGQLFMRMMKTKHPLYLNLNREAVEALAALPVKGACFFWYQEGECLLDSSIEHARRTVARIARIAGVEGAHPHRFRDTFAKELLLGGATMRTVQLLLGHTSVRTTEKHYAAFMPEHQDALDRATATLNFAA